MLHACRILSGVIVVGWLAASASSAAGAEPAVAPDEQSATLDDLAWMVGDWVVEQTEKESPPGDEPPQSIAMHVRWSPTRAFLIREMTIHRAATQVAHYTQRIGRDPRTDTLRSWLFDDR